MSSNLSPRYALHPWCSSLSTSLYSFLKATDSLALKSVEDLTRDIKQLYRVVPPKSTNWLVTLKVVLINHSRAFRLLRGSRLTGLLSTKLLVSCPILHLVVSLAIVDLLALGTELGGWLTANIANVFLLLHFFWLQFMVFKWIDYSGLPSRLGKIILTVCQSGGSSLK